MQSLFMLFILLTSFFGLLSFNTYKDVSINRENQRVVENNNTLTDYDNEDSYFDYDD